MKAPAVITLDPAAVYLSPQGLRCTFVPSDGERFQQPWATLLYCRQDGTPRPATDSNVWSHSFSLMPANFHILRRLS
jgi:hypothetical protein